MKHDVEIIIEEIRDHGMAATAALGFLALTTICGEHVVEPRLSPAMTALTGSAGHARDRDHG